MTLKATEGHVIRQDHGHGGTTTYTLLRLIAPGAEGLTWHARRRGPAGDMDEVAIKAISDYWLRPDDDPDPLEPAAMRERLKIMIGQHRRMRRVRSPGVAVADDVFCAHEDWLADVRYRNRALFSGAVRPIAVTAWVPGTTLDEWNRHNLKPRRRIEALRDVAHAIDEAHADETLLRDIKPNNFVVTRAGRAVYVDFGIITRRGDELAGATGTPRWRDRELTRPAGDNRLAQPGSPFAPEPSPASDRWSLAAVAFYQLTDAFPPDPEIPADWDVAADLSEIGYPVGVQTLLERALGQVARRRPTIATVFLAELERELAPLEANGFQVPPTARALRAVPRRR